MWRTLALILLCSPNLTAATKPHVVAFGKWMTVKLPAGDDNHAVEVKIRPLLIDARVKEFTFGPAHEVTEQTFVVQRIYRLNDSLPDESTLRWQWQRGGWLLVNKQSGKVQALLLPAFDPYHSAVAWFRDYAAYCGISDDGKKLFAMVAQIGRRKPLLKKEAGQTLASEAQACDVPLWQRSPARVTFGAPNQQKFTYAVQSRAIDLISEDEDSGEQ